MRLGRGARNFWKARFHGAFRLGQRMGFDLLPRHFYSGIPDLRELEQTTNWRGPSSMAGVAGIDVDGQLETLREWARGLTDRFQDKTIHSEACRLNGAEGFGSIEALCLYAFVFATRPRRIVQVGCGVSTAVMLRAAGDARYQPAIVCIDPFPTDYVRAAAGVRLREEPMQRTPLEVFTELGAGDLLFVDSTHAVRAGGEVNRIILEILPRLKGGVYAHFHDIYFPYDYPSSLMSSLFFPAESTLLHAFLAGNTRWSVAVSLSMLHHARTEDLKKVFPAYHPARMRDGLHTDGLGDFPSSTYLVSGEKQSSL